MRGTRLSILVLVLLSQGWGSAQTTTARLAAVNGEVRSFMRSVAAEITSGGPSAWRNYLANDPAFFMAVDGRLQYSDGAAAQAAIPNLAQTIRNIQLRWGDDLRVDPLADNLAVAATTWNEVMTLSDGTRKELSGYFTAVAERRGGRWQFRNAHWSTRPAGTGQ